MAAINKTLEEVLGAEHYKDGPYVRGSSTLKPGNTLVENKYIFMVLYSSLSSLAFS